MSDLILRYVRPTQLNLEQFTILPKPNGGIILLFEIDQDNDLLTFSFAICKEDEPFNYSISEKIVKVRFAAGNSFEIPYRRYLSLVENVLSFLNGNITLPNPPLPQNLQTLKNKLSSYVKNNTDNQRVYDNIVVQISNSKQWYE